MKMVYQGPRRPIIHNGCDFVAVPGREYDGAEAEALRAILGDPNPPSAPPEHAAKVAPDADKALPSPEPKAASKASASSSPSKAKKRATKAKK